MIATSTFLAARQLPEEFERLFREHSEFVYRTAYRVTGSESDAEDVLQTLFLRLLRNPLPPLVHQNARAYLYRAAVNTALNVVRSRKHQGLADNMEDASWNAKFREEIRIAMSELKPRAAEIFILRHVHGYSDAEIGKLLGTSRGSIAISLFRSRSRLRKSIRKLLGDKS